MKISIRKYAALLGTSHTTVNSAIKDGYIRKGYDRISKKIDSEIADKEWGNDYKTKKANRIEAANAEITQPRLDELSAITVEEITLYPTDTYIEAERKKLIIQGQRELIKLKAESGELVNKEAMYREMFEFGKELRLALHAIPDRIIDELLTLDRHNAHRLLVSAINETLEKLSNEGSD